MSGSASYPIGEGRDGFDQIRQVVLARPVKPVDHPNDQILIKLAPVPGVEVDPLLGVSVVVFQ